MVVRDYDMTRGLVEVVSALGVVRRFCDLLLGPLGVSEVASVVTLLSLCRLASEVFWPSLDRSAPLVVVAILEQLGIVA